MLGTGCRVANHLQSPLTAVGKRTDGKSSILPLSAPFPPLLFPQSLVDSLSVLLEHEREESEAQRVQLKEEMEEVLGELAVAEEQERQRQEETGQALQRLQQENQDLVLQLSRWDTKGYPSNLHIYSQPVIISHK